MLCSTSPCLDGVSLDASQAPVQHGCTAYNGCTSDAVSDVRLEATPSSACWPQDTADDLDQPPARRDFRITCYLANPAHAAHHTPEQGMHSVAVAVGANVGDRVANIREALRLLPAHGIQVCAEHAALLCCHAWNRLHESLPSSNLQLQHACAVCPGGEAVPAV